MMPLIKIQIYFKFIIQNTLARIFNSNLKDSYASGIDGFIKLKVITLFKDVKINILNMYC